MQLQVFLRRAAGPFGLLALTLLATAHLVRAVLPEPYIPFVSDKLEHLAAHRDSYDVLFVGSSRVYRHVAPGIFDQVLAAAGRPVRSFNVGIPAMRLAETTRILERVLTLAPGGLDYVFLEPPRAAALISEDNILTRREVYWHDVRGTVRALQAVRCCARGGERRRRAYRLHLRTFLFRELNVGLIPAVLGPRERPRLRPGQTVLGANGDGFVPLTVVADKPQGKHRDSFLAGLDSYRLEVDNLRRPSAGSYRLTTFEAATYAHLRALTEARGARLFFVVSPVLDRRGELREAVQQGVVEGLFAFNDPTRHPRFYDVDLRFDRGHLRDRGAEIFTRRLAEEFLAFLEEKAGE